uniref:Complement component 1 Q subcomponent-binding protein, mitochondrial n=1 Tax=Clastoptera arizonana TaxID=38151 RepID=A0A1B6CV40_9HEMI
MNGIIKTTLKLNSLRSITNTARNNTSLRRQFTRNLWYMCSRSNDQPTKNLKITTPSFTCSCGCGNVMHAHSKTEQELVEFLKDEISAERKIQKTKTIPTEVDGFKVKLEGSEVSLIKCVGDETIEINFNVNHSVDTDAEPEITPSSDKADVALKSKPTFEVDIKRGNTTLGFTCSFITGQSEESPEDGYTDDIFGIDELALYEGEWKDSNYAVAGDVLDGYLYDLLMNFLDEKGITNELIEKVSDFSTAYEHSSYIALLESLQKFAAKK